MTTDIGGALQRLALAEEAPPGAPIQRLPLDAARHLLTLLPKDERKALGQTCRLFDAAARDLRREAAGWVLPGRAAAAAVVAMLARNPGVHKLRVAILPGQAAGEPARLRDLAGRVRSLEVSSAAPHVFDLTGLGDAFPALADLHLDLGARSSAPGLGALRALRALTGLTLVGVASDAGLSKVTRLRRLAIHLPDHGDVPRECEDCDDVHEEVLYELAEAVDAEEPVAVGRAL